MALLKDLRLPPIRTRKFEFVRKTRDGAEVPCEVRIKLLTSAELDLASAEALRSARSLFKAQEASERSETEKTSTFEEILRRCRNAEFLQWALRDPDPKYEDVEQYPRGAPPWATSLELREIFGHVELALLERAYEDHEYEVGPFKHELSKEEFESMLLLAAAGTRVDPQEFYGTNLRIKLHSLMAKEILDGRAALAEKDAEIERLKESLAMLEEPGDEG